MTGYAGGDCSPGFEIFSFGYKHGPPEAECVIDVRFLPNAYWVPELRPRTGLDPEVAAHALDTETGRRFLVLLEPLVAFLVAEQIRAGKGGGRLAVGCTGGRHRSVAVVERLQRLLSGRFPSLRFRHRDIDKV
ncbi:MAG: hypothetical protein BWK76_16530 [Desulfobulbaceae bacterium A2]|nr:MAG: hypothetical protein BWK76_16530 [Desulfobulbaceae bacterium A2]